MSRSARPAFTPSGMYSRWRRSIASRPCSMARARPDELFAANERMTWHQDEPFGSTSIYAQWHVFALAAQHRVKAMLDGQGAARRAVRSQRAHDVAPG